MTTGEIPERCQSCNASLTDVPFEASVCPHCGHDVVNNPPHFGSEQWSTLPSRHRVTEPDIMMSREPRKSDG